jgi:hypothetical protein
MKTLKTLMIAGVFIFLASAAFAQVDTHWLGGDGSWSDDNWDNGNPGSGDNAFLDSSGTVSFDDTSGATFGRVIIDNMQTFEVAENPFSAASDEEVILGGAGSGYWYQTGSTVDITANFIQGDSASGSGYYSLSEPDASNSATLNVNGNHLIGWGGWGQFDQTGGTHSVSGDMNLAQGEPSTGSYYMNAGYLGVDGSVNAGHDGHGTFSLYGADSIVNIGYHLVLGNNPAGEGFFEMWDGTVNTVEAQVGLGGTGTFEQNHGTMNIHDGSLWLAVNDNSSGTYEIYNDAALNLSDTNAGDITYADIIVGNRGNGLFLQDGGTVNVNRNVVISATPGVSAGEYRLSGGTLSAGTINNHDRFNYSGGALHANIANSAGATVELSGPGTRTIDGVIHNYGTFQVTDTTAEVTGEFRNFNRLVSDATSHSYFHDLIVEEDGFLQAGWISVAGDFKSKSALNTDYQTVNGQLIFTNGAHDVIFNGADVGPDEFAGYDNNFNWGDVNFGGGTFTLLALDGGTWGALYAGTIAPNSLIIQNGLVTSIVSGNSNIYYLGQYNEWLNWGTYNFADGDTLGQLRPVGVVPEPMSCALFLLGAGALTGARRLRRKT